MESWLSDAVVVDRDEPKAKRQRKENTPIFKKDLLKDEQLPYLQQSLKNHHPIVDVKGTYRIPLNTLSKNLLTQLKGFLTTEPKRVMRGKVLVHKPWAMYVLTAYDIHIPRGIGVHLFSLDDPPPKRTVPLVEPRVVYPTPTRPLLNAAAAEAMHKTDQETAVDNLVSHLHTMVDTYGFGTATFCLPTGHGKTCCALHLIARLGKRALFVVPSMDPCCQQFKDEVERFLGPSVTVGSMHTSNKKAWIDHDTADCVVTTMASLSQCDYDMSGFGLVIVDEAHESVTRARSALYLKLSSTFVVALTATPERHSDHCGAYIEWLCGPVVLYKSIDVAGNRWGGLTVRIVPIQGVCFQESKNKQGDVNDAALINKVMMSRERNRAIRDYINALVNEEDRHVVCLSPRTWHIETITSLLERSGTDAGMLVGQRLDGSNPTASERDDAKTKRVLVANVSMGSRALNVPRLDTLCYITGGCWNNETFWTQAIGRVLRDKEDKNKPVVVLFVDETNGGYLERQVNRAVATLKRIGGDGTHVEHAPPLTC